MEELKLIRERMKVTNGARHDQRQTQIVIGMGTCGIGAGARNTLLAVMNELTLLDLDNVSVTQTGCMGMCEREPLLEIRTIEGESYLYAHVDAERARRIVANHVQLGQPMTQWIIKRGQEAERWANEKRSLHLSTNPVD
jgi:NADP-reducing hydrogenase subunit HndB